jgi:hypothetical protein
MKVASLLETWLGRALHAWIERNKSVRIKLTRSHLFQMSTNVIECKKE